MNAVEGDTATATMMAVQGDTVTATMMAVQGDTATATMKAVQGDTATATMKAVQGDTATATMKAAQGDMAGGWRVGGLHSRWSGTAVNMKDKRWDSCQHEGYEVGQAVLCLAQFQGLRRAGLFLPHTSARQFTTHMTMPPHTQHSTAPPPLPNLLIPPLTKMHDSKTPFPDLPSNTQAASGPVCLTHQPRGRLKEKLRGA